MPACWIGYHGNGTWSELPSRRPQIRLATLLIVAELSPLCKMYKHTDTHTRTELWRYSRFSCTNRYPSMVCWLTLLCSCGFSFIFLMRLSTSDRVLSKRFLVCQHKRTGAHAWGLSSHGLILGQLNWQRLLSACRQAVHVWRNIFSQDNLCLSRGFLWASEVSTALFHFQRFNKAFR